MNKKTLIIIEVLTAYIIFSVLFRLISFGTHGLEWHYMWRNVVNTVWAVSVPALLIWVTKTDVGFKTWRAGIYGGFIVFWLGFVQSFWCKI